MIIKILSAVALAIAAVLISAALKPDTIRVRRSLLIDAPASEIFQLVDDFHNWKRWAPQDRTDPLMERTYSGPPSGKGAMSNWRGQGSTGQGRMTVVESTSPEKIVVVADFEKPFPTHNRNEFTFVPSGHGTRVDWAMEGTNLYIMKLMGVFLNMDHVMGQHFETGLQNLKQAAESDRTKHP